jgi:hypothetical protein
MSLPRAFLRCCMAGVLLAANLALAEADLPGGKQVKRWYRYYNDAGIPMLSDQITEEHVRRGYDVLDRNMLIVRRIPAFNQEAYEKDKVRRDAMLLQQQEDARILRLYATARDAELARNRLLDTLETSIGYNGIQLMRLKRLRSDAVAEAAEAERSGKGIPAKMKSQISQLDQQIQDLVSLMNSQRSEQQKVRVDFVPIIKRLTELESNRKADSSTTSMTPNR